MNNLSEWQPEPGLSQYVAANLHHPSESLILHQMAQQVRAEIQYREAFNQYCEWYAAIALEHQRDLVKMQGESQLLTWTSEKQRNAQGKLTS